MTRVTLATAIGLLAAAAALSSGGHAEPSPARVLDRTYVCATELRGGIYLVEARAHSGRRDGSEWAKLPYAAVASGAVARTPAVDSAPENSLAWVSAGTPTADTTLDLEWLAFTARAGGTIGVNRALCDPTRASVPVSPSGLRPVSAVSGAIVDCGAPRKVLIRVRATLRGSTALRERARIFVATGVPATEATLAVRTLSGKPLVHASVRENGKARLFTAERCVTT